MFLRVIPSGAGWLVLTAVLGFMLAFSCARQGFPPGGPEDKAAPEVVRILPEPLSTNVSTRESIIFEFSEAMNEQGVEDNLFIVPIPAEWPEITWREGGRVLILDFPGGLRDNATYVITVGAKATDRRNNPLRDSIILTFSTGPEIEQGIIRGRVIPWTFFGPSPENAAGVDVIAYRLSDAVQTPDPRDDVPDYVTQTGADGSFTLVGVSSGQYRLFAIGDKDRNGFYTSGYDMIGVASRDLGLARGDTLALAPHMAISEMDTAMVQLSSVRSIDRHRVEINFDSAIDPDSVAIAIEGLAIPGWFIPANEPRKVSVATAEQQNGKNYTVSALRLRGRDGNPLAPPEKPPVFTGTDRADTMALEIVEWEPKVLTPGKDPVRLLFNRVLSLPDTLRKIIADASGENVTVTRTGPNRLAIHPADRWRQATVYRLAFDPEALKGVAGNRLTGPGTQFSFRVAPEDTLGFISGSISDESGAEKSLYRLRFKNLDFGTLKELEVPGRQEWKTDSLLPGRYVALGHRDDDGDGTIFRGSVDPYRPAEPVYALSDTIVVEPEKTVSGMRFIFR
ncbi:MAG: Ig-like domain-containing domain [Candidatus Latescibacterota bacterium]